MADDPQPTTGLSYVPKGTLNYKFAFIGQKWKFLDEDGEFEGCVFQRRAKMEAEIAELEKEPIKERILEHYRTQVNGNDSQTVHTAPSVTTTETTITPDIDVQPELTEEEKFELSTSLHMLKMFYDERHKVEEGRIVMQPTQPSRVVDSPRTALQTSSLPTDSKLQDTLLATAPTIERKELTMLSVQASLERKMLKSMLHKELLAANQQNRRKISVSNAEKMRQRIAAVGEHLKLIDISKYFKKYVEDKGSRLPHFLRKVDVNAPSVSMKDSEIKAMLAQHRQSSARSTAIMDSIVPVVPPSPTRGLSFTSHRMSARSAAPIFSAATTPSAISTNTHNNANGNLSIRAPEAVTMAARAPEVPMPTKKPNLSHRKVSFSGTLL